MLQLLVVHALVAMAATPLVRRWGRKAFLPLALAPASAAVYAATRTGAVLAGDPPHQEIPWVPLYGMDLVLRMDVLSWLMTLIVGGVGALVLVYCAAYFSSTAQDLGRFGGVFVAFAGAMLGLVVTDSSLMLYVFWELTTIFSFLLIGHYHERQGSRRAALQAIIVTTFGGLAMLAGIVILGEIEGGSYSLSGLVASAQAGALGGSDGATPVTAAVILVLVGAMSKSALVPTHFWLPAAMAAPTPVSAYLHAAAMVKAGVYLVARLAPGFADLPGWRVVVLSFALTTMIIGGYRALRQHDLKLVLAFGTVSQLGFITALVGYGDSAVALAGLAMLLAHALFKACLFLSVGIVDWATGTRDLRELSGLGRRRPVLASAAAIAGLSMMGAPPLSGYVAKEAALHALEYQWLDPVLTGHAGGATTAVITYVVIAIGSVLTAAYTLRFWWGAFCSKPGVEPTEARSTSALILFSPVVLAVASLGLGLVPGTVERFLAPHADTFPGHTGHLTLWGGVGVALWTTVGILVLGVLLFVARAPVERAQDRVPDLEGAEGLYRRGLRVLDNFAADLTAWVQRGSLPAYLSVLLTTLVVTVVASLVLGDVETGPIRLYDSPGQVPVVAVMCIAAVLVARARRRLKAVVLLGVVGYGMVLIFEMHGAPDLALTQILAESITLVVFILVLRRLPAYFSNRPLLASRWWRLLLSVSVGVTVAAAAVVAAWSRIHPPVSVNFPVEAYEYGYGQNVVNVALVDMRAWDTMGEISVVVAAATGVASLIFLRRRHGSVDRLPAEQADRAGKRVWSTGQPVPEAYQHLTRPAGSQRPDAWVREPGRGRQWLAGTATLAPHRRSVIFEMGVRLIFHTMIVFSIYLLFAGHNQPGGGFAAALVTGIALGVRYLAGGRYELAEAMPVLPGVLLGAGLITALGTALAPLAFGGTVLQSADVYVNLGPLGEVHLVSAMVFDIGVYLVCVGLMLDLLSSLGAEVDRQGEAAGTAAPDVAHDAVSAASDDVVPASDARLRDEGFFDVVGVGQLSAEKLQRRERSIRRRHARGIGEEGGRR